MADLAQRFDDNPLITPQDVPPSREGLEVACVLNPGAFRFQGRTGLLMRVAERPPQKPDAVSTLIHDPESADGVRVVEAQKDDPGLSQDDPRLFFYNGIQYLTTLSHLRLAWSEDETRFQVEPAPALQGQGPYEVFGLEDGRVTALEGAFYVTCSAVSRNGCGVGLSRTQDFETFEPLGLALPPDNKDGALFEEKVGGRYWCLHRPMSKWGLRIWTATSPDLRHWGDYTCIASPRPGMWDEERVGGGAAPVKTEAGWLEIYHGADRKGRYCLGALLLALDDPNCVLARSHDPIMEPNQPYEQEGFYGNCVFTNGHVVDGDTLTLYYGASDSVICGATLSIREVLDSLDA